MDLSREALILYPKEMLLHGSLLTLWPQIDFSKNLDKEFSSWCCYWWMDVSQDISLRWTSVYLTNDQSTLVQVMAWCRQATSPYLSTCWLRSVLPYGITRPQWVNVLVSLCWHIVNLNKMVDILQMTFSNASYWQKIFLFPPKFLGNSF